MSLVQFNKGHSVVLMQYKLTSHPLMLRYYTGRRFTAKHVATPFPHIARVKNPDNPQSWAVCLLPLQSKKKLVMALKEISQCGGGGLSL